MRLLLDTHSLIWWLEQSKKLSLRARRVIGSGHHDIFVSAASAWEIATKVKNGKLKFNAAFLVDFDASVRALNFEPLAMTSLHAVTGAQLPGAHGDPFDRMLAGQAAVEKLKLVMSDPAIGAFGVETLW